MAGKLGKEAHWSQALVNDLWKIQPKYNSSGIKFQGDPRAYALIRNSIRGDGFILGALPYIIPSLPSTRNGTALYIDEALLIAQLYCLYAPTAGNQEGDADGDEELKWRQSVGFKLRKLQNSTEESGHPTSSERLLRTLIHADLDILAKRLRGAIQQISKSKYPMRYIDFLQLAYDIAFWDSEDKRVQKRWISDYYWK